MRSSSLDAAAATLKQDLREPPSVLDHRIPEGGPQCVSDPPTYCIRAAGVLSYNRESDNNRINLTPILPASQALTEYPVKCEYCGEKARPSLDLTWAQGPERQQLCKMLVKQRCVVEGRCDLRTGTPTSPRDKPATDIDELLFKGKEMADHNRFIMELPGGLGEQSQLRLSEDYSIQLPVAQPSVPKSKVLSFRLSCPPLKGCWTVCPCSATEKHLKTKEEEEVLVPFCEHKPLLFGICRHQDGAQILQKYYSNGMKFLTVFPDGSAQVFYPSGLLALVVVVTEENGRVCIVYDDSSYQPIRALFQSDGRATCYHSNRNIWLSLNSSGGQCLDEVGARVRRWSWSSRGVPPTPLYPVFLSLNKTVGVRVFGKERVFVSFLARGQQAKFSVGTCGAQDESKTVGATSGAAELKEDLFVQAARIRIHLVIQHLHQYLMTPSRPRLQKTKQAPHLHAVAQRLLEVSADV
ncbi:glutamate-rich protein 6 isoform X2 [Anarrhichthys ocellatus]|uniref:glutamate-rich protein 6 isoform X2 n=1 Tax=Anarrhichthys ocellatus TaxID=433405 RepID=UPI0012EEBA8F|nr:glutamate-rich protein 6-like isoform X2 [Anarrhichthys ocellatus]